MVYRLEAGEDTTVSSLLAVASALGLALRLEPAGLPPAQEIAASFLDDEDDVALPAAAPTPMHGPSTPGGLMLPEKIRALAVSIGADAEAGN